MSIGEKIDLAKALSVELDKRRNESEPGKSALYLFIRSSHESSSAVEPWKLVAEGATRAGLLADLADRLRKDADFVDLLDSKSEVWSLLDIEAPPEGNKRNQNIAARKLLEEYANRMRASADDGEVSLHRDAGSEADPIRLIAIMDEARKSKRNKLENLLRNYYIWQALRNEGVLGDLYTPGTLLIGEPSDILRDATNEASPWEDEVWQQKIDALVCAEASQWLLNIRTGRRDDPFSRMVTLCKQTGLLQSLLGQTDMGEQLLESVGRLIDSLQGCEKVFVPLLSDQTGVMLCLMSFECLRGEINYCKDAKDELSKLNSANPGMTEIPAQKRLRAKITMVTEFIRSGLGEVATSQNQLCFAAVVPTVPTEFSRPFLDLGLKEEGGPYASRVNPFGWVALLGCDSGEALANYAMVARELIANTYLAFNGPAPSGLPDGYRAYFG